MSVVFSLVSFAHKSRLSGLAVLIVSVGLAAASAQAQTATTTVLAVSPASTQTVGGVATLTATVTANSASVTAPGTVVFCDDTTGYCGFLAQLGTAQITSAGTATLKVRLAPGTHNLYAKFRGTPNVATPSTNPSNLGASTSFLAATSYSVSVTSTTYPVASVMTATGSDVANSYTLTNTLITAPASTVPTSLSAAFTDTVSGVTLATASYGSTGSSVLLSPGAVYQMTNMIASNYTFNAVRALVKGDFNNDGITDVLVLGSVGTNSGSLTPSYVVLSGNASPAGTFTQGAAHTLLDSPTYVVTGDFNNDGYLDFAIVSATGIYVYLDTPGTPGTFTAPSSALVTANGTTPYGLAVGDFNGDGNLDLAVGMATGGTASGFQIYVGNGSGGFSASTSVTTTNPVKGIGAADFNGDGYTDLFVVTSSGATLQTPAYYQNTGTTGYFSSTATTESSLVSTTNSAGNTVVLADLKNDGDLDAIYLTNGGVALTVNTAGANATPVFGAITLTAGTSNTGTAGIAVGDFNHDGTLDVAAGNLVGQVEMFAGTSTPSFSAPAYYSAYPGASAEAYALTAGDFTGSGLTDVAAGIYTEYNPVSVLFSGYQTTAGATTPSAVTLADGARQVDVITSATNYSPTTFTSNTEILDGGEMSLTASPNDTSSFGSTVTLKATISPSTIESNGNQPTGTVTFYDLLSSGTVKLSPSETLTNGVASLPISTLSVGNHTLVAQYSGDSNYPYSSGAPLTSQTLPYKVTSSTTASTDGMTFIVSPLCTTSGVCGSGASPGLVQVALEDSSGNVLTSTGNFALTLTYGAGPTTYATFTVGTNPSGVPTGSFVPTPTYTNGVATFDLSTLSLFSTTATTWTLTVTDPISGKSASKTIYVSAPTGLYVVTKYGNTTGGTCNNKVSGFTYGSAGTLDANCTIDAALANAATSSNSSSTSAVILFDVTKNGYAWPQTITLTANYGVSGYEPYALTMVGPGPTSLVINGASTHTFLKQNAGGTANNLNISGLTIENMQGTGNGPALFVYGPLNLSNVLFYGNNSNSTNTGGAMYVSSSDLSAVNINNSTFQNNSDTSTAGGAISYSGLGSLNINNSAFIGNQAGSSGGAIISASAPGAGTTVTYSITNSLFWNNSNSRSTSTTAFGGAINLSPAPTSATGTATVTLTNDTFYLNSNTNTSTGSAYGGAIYVNGNSTGAVVTATFTNLTVVGNSVTGGTGTAGCYGGGIVADAYTNWTMYNSVVEGNQATCNGSGTARADIYYSGTGHLSGNGNIYDTSVTTSAAPYPGLSALGLSDLGSYGGPTMTTCSASCVPGSNMTTQAIETLVPLPGSTLLKNDSLVSGETAPTTDQRGFVRPATGTNTIDTGAVQTNLGLAFTTQPSNTAVNTAISPAPVVYVTDTGFDLATGTAGAPTITMTIEPGNLGGTTSVASGATGASFGSLTSSSAETGATLIATVGSGSSAISVASNTFNITAGSATQLAFGGDAPAATITAGSSPGAVVGIIEDTYGNPVTTNNSTQITLTVTGPSNYSQTYSGTASSGSVTFSPASLTTPGTYSYALSSSPVLTAPAAVSQTVTINPTALMLSVTPSTTEPYGTELKLTGTLSPYSQGTASTNGETVTFKSNGTSIGTGTLASGVATLSIASLGVGSNSLTASYAGDTSFSASSASAMSETSTPPPFAAIKSGTPVTVTLTFTNNFTMGSTSPSIATSGTANSPFAITGGTCAASTAYGPSSAGGTSCTVTVTYTPTSSSPATGGGFITGTVQAFDTNSVLQGASNVTLSRYR